MSTVGNFPRKLLDYVQSHALPRSMPEPAPEPVPEPPVEGFFPIDAWADAAYDDWFYAHKVSDSEVSRQKAVAGDFAVQPMFSFIVPLYKTPSEYLHTMADSVLAQTYGKLELVLVNASPEMDVLAAEVAAYAHADARVKVVTLESNLGITENTNHGIAAATGDFCCFLDHDDFIEPDLLFEYVKVINEAPEIDVLYCDEDLVYYDEKTERFRHQNPLMKASFSPELLLCRNYVVHLMTIRRSIIKSMPKPDARFDGSQDYNMLLYATHKARAVHGVQKCLYHWRISETSTATNPDSKPYSLRSCRLAISGQLERRNLNAKIVDTGLYLVHAVWFGAHSSEGPLVSVVVDCSDEEIFARRFLEMFAQNNSYKNVELILVECPAAVQTDYAQNATFVAADGMGRYARSNKAVEQAKGDYLIFLDTKCSFATPEPVEQLIGMCAIEGVGAVAPKTLYRGGIVKSHGVCVVSQAVSPLGRGYDDAHPGYQCSMRTFRNVSALGLQGLCTAREVFDTAGGFDERFSSEIGAVEYCIRLREKGLRMVTTPTVKLNVDEACPEARYIANQNSLDYSDADLALFDEKWPGLRAAGDPYYNRNLDQSNGYCQVPHVECAE